MAVVVSASGTKAVGGTGLTTQTYSNITVNSGDAALIATLTLNSNSATIPSAVTATWNAVSMTLISSRAILLVSGVGSWVGIFGIRNPTSGAHSVVFNWTTASFPTSCALSFTGVDTSSDANAFKNANSAGGTSVTSSLTVTTTAADIPVAVHILNNGFSSANFTTLYSDTTTGGSDTCANYTTAQSPSATITATQPASGAWSNAGISVTAPTAAALPPGANLNAFMA